MAPKRPTPMEEDPPAADSTTEEEEDEGSSSSDDASSSEEEKEKTPKPSSPPPSQKQQQQQQQPPKKPETITTTTTTTTTQTPQSSSESEESESDSDESESEKTPKPIGSPDPNVKPISTRPMKETPKTTKPRSKTTASGATAKSTAKRAIDNDTDRKDPKKAKKDDDDSKQSTAADPKKQLFQRLWSEGDEIAVLKGMLEYSAKKGADPVTEMNGFLEYIKNSLHFDVTKSQLNDKIRRLKKKYENNLGRGKKGEDPVFSKPHEQKAYEISKKVWGGEAVESSAASKFNGKAARTPRPNSKASVTPKLAELAAASPDGKKMKMKVDEIKGESQSGSEVVLFDKNVGLAGMDEYVIKHGLELVDDVKRAELEERWRKLQLAQLELFVERSELIFDQAKLMLEAAKSSNQ